MDLINGNFSHPVILFTVISLLSGLVVWLVKISRADRRDYFGKLLEIQKGTLRCVSHNTCAIRALTRMTGTMGEKMDKQEMQIQRVTDLLVDHPHCGD
jgi:hypothetical protein